MGNVKTVLREARAMGFVVEHTRGSHLRFTALNDALVFRERHAERLVRDPPRSPARTQTREGKHHEAENCPNRNIG